MSIGVKHIFKCLKNIEVFSRKSKTSRAMQRFWNGIRFQKWIIRISFNQSILRVTKQLNNRKLWATLRNDLKRVDAAESTENRIFLPLPCCAKPFYSKLAIWNTARINANWHWLAKPKMFIVHDTSIAIANEKSTVVKPKTFTFDSKREHWMFPTFILTFRIYFMKKTTSLM